MTPEQLIQPYRHYQTAPRFGLAGLFSTVNSYLEIS
jgi:hypothetical protein